MADGPSDYKGWCKLPGSNWQFGWTADACARQGGQWSETGPDTPAQGGGCFITSILTRSLGQAILDLGKTYQSQIDFRDDVLSSSPLGSRMVATYYKFNPTIPPIVMGDYELLAESIGTWLSIQDFVKASVASAGGHGAASAEHRGLRFGESQHRRILCLLDRFRAGSSDPEFHAALEEVKEELAGYVGLTPHDAIARLRRHEVGGPCSEGGSEPHGGPPRKGGSHKKGGTSRTGS